MEQFTKLFTDFNLAQLVTILLQCAIAVAVFIKLGKWKPNANKQAKELTPEEKELLELQTRMKELKEQMKPVKEKKLSNTELLQMIANKLGDKTNTDDTTNT